MGIEEGPLPPDLESLVTEAKVLVVGAGGIGCEVLKNLVLTGFKDIHIIDLDTIDVSNLNRQFLFRREHVGQPKAIVAKESALQFNPFVNITSYHDSITEQKYDSNFYKQFSMVLNALDNRAARSHVNRMCLAANIPLIESGSSGYKGNVSLHKRGVSECYDCTSRPHQKTFPGCTIRNTPSEPIHCIVWAKHLFNQLFGLPDPDQDVSPDGEDPEAMGQVAKAALESNGGNGKRTMVSTRQWAKDVDYAGDKLFQKLFNEDIKYLLAMENLWLQRRPPTPLQWGSLPDSVATSSRNMTQGVGGTGLKDQRVWSVKECGDVFAASCTALKLRAQGGNEELIWDKDDDDAMNFVTACANIRSYIFGIQQKSRFDVKSMAGNIIPAIPSTNAIVAGLVVITAFNVLRQAYHKCPTLYVNNRVNVRKVLFAVDPVVAPKPNCFVCAEKPEIVVRVDVSKMTVRALGDRILKKELNMVAPDVEIDDGQGTILISSEEGETDDIADKVLQDLNVRDGTRLKCDDFLQNYQLILMVIGMKEEDVEREKTGELFEIVGDRSHLNPLPSTAPAPNGNGMEPQPSTSKFLDIVSTVEDEDDLMIIEPEEEITEIPVSEKVKRTSIIFPPSESDDLPAKKRRIGELEMDQIHVVSLDD